MVIHTSDALTASIVKTFGDSAEMSIPTSALAAGKSVGCGSLLDSDAKQCLLGGFAG
jgi:hypothetical protein